MDRQDPPENVGSVTPATPFCYAGCSEAHLASSPDQGPVIAVVFSGGDSPGMNPLLRFLVRLGLNRHGARIVGIKDGFAGLVRTCNRITRGDLNVANLRREMALYAGSAGIHRRALDVVLLDHVSVSGLTARGGIILGTARCPEFHDSGTRGQVAELLEGLGVDALINVGGNGTLEGARRLAAEAGMIVVAIPATIDDDVDSTERALGFDTAVNNAMRAIEQINDTANSHHRIMVVETMGRDCGNLALTAALTAGVEIVVTPERGPLTAAKMTAIAERLQQSFDRGQTHAVVLIAEGVKTSDERRDGAAAFLRRFLEAHFQRCSLPAPRMEVRDNVLGHLQRGGSPTAADRILAAQFAEAAWEAIMASPQQSGVLGLRSGQICLGAFEGSPPADVEVVQKAIYALQKSASKWV